MQILNILDVELSRPNLNAIAYAKQWDKKSRYVGIHLFNGGVDWTPPDGAVFEVRGRKPDGRILKYSQLEDGTDAVTVSGAIATVGLAQQALACAGCVRLELAVIDGADILTSFSFSVVVEESAVYGIASDDYLRPALTTFRPSVSEAGVISWTNDGGLPNPEPVSIRGATGARLVSRVKTGETADGSFIYTDTFDDGTTAVWTAPRGPEGDGDVSSVNGISPINGNVTLAVEDVVDTGDIVASMIGNGAVTEAKIGTGAVTGAKIAAGSVTRDKLPQYLILSLNDVGPTLPTTDIVDGRLFFLIGGGA